MRKITIIILLFSFCLAEAQQSERDNDIIEIAKVYFNSRLELQKRQENIYIEIKSSKNYKKLFESVLKNKRFDFRDKSIYEKFFKEEQVQYYLKQIPDSKFDFSKCEIETDNIYVYNPKRDFMVVRDNLLISLSSNNVYRMGIPIFTEDNQFAIFIATEPYAHSSGIYIFKKTITNEWQYHNGAICHYPK